VLLPGDWPLGWKLSNYGMRLPNEGKDAGVCSSGLQMKPYEP
jgi:hypothetical protein